ncbi:BREX system P-loop protein BrxC [Crocosphaera sp. XPORK-15E]|uniref:BREX system P-loop protein BrxC n=1 Tax=Crocosphaera sp. XPORK-15E TaxID=3110247 RepID=UPI002B1F1A94|nr:BREX system P-loop protein BrxC [Crocosphaera sp. XPORK-15E]MEA5536775.1 BREX system P-loop protein BrxC [Crocosphaera sp. XPORK-15E]
MKLRTIFNQQVDRPIEGVIKADANDEVSLHIELEEYVLTNEVEKRLETFLEAYNNYTGVNGVWISGFFGSGKSHLLKILALLLENRRVKNSPVIDRFLPKCQDNKILQGDLKRAVTIPSKSILFNIDQKADVTSKTAFDALLSVFFKVFNEACGYYGKQGYIAQFEKDLDSRELYGEFQIAYEKVSGKPWERGREQVLLEKKNIAVAYAEITGETVEDSKGILDQYRQDYKLSIEGFAKEVKAFIDKQSPNFRLNFFVDEVGQYIAENVKLMTNLQTIAESLATKCQGRAWVVVTAQEDMETVLGEMGNHQTKDFSKIQDRFANRMKLTSRDVAEVIQKRLLLKNEEGIRLLSEIFEQQQHNLPTLFRFTDGSTDYRNFQDKDHFIQCYPFIPYQFTLFQSAIRGLSQHNAFEGKHSSVGERSMLGVFQEVAISIEGQDIGGLATFDLMFQGIRSTLKSNIQSAIILAEDNLNNPFAVRLLKALFLVKYVEGFKANLHNLSILMLEEFEQDISALRNQVQEALNLLEQQTYIQRTGELYEYLTDKEKDIEQEIKNTEVEVSKVLEELNRLIFDEIIKNSKIRNGDGTQDYPYSRKIDGTLYKREYELSIQVITPFSGQHEQETALQMDNMGRDELLIIIPSDDRFVSDFIMYKKTEKYYQQNISVTQHEAVKSILNQKNQSNEQRYGEIKNKVKSLLGKAKLFVAGTELDISSNDAQIRIISGFQKLISRVYPHLKMLAGVTYKAEQVNDFLQHSQESLFANDVNPLSEPEKEVFSFIQMNEKRGLRTSMKSLKEHFERKPYGWSEGAMLCMVAKLCARGKLEVQTEGNLLEAEALVEAISNSGNYNNVLLQPQQEFTSSQVRKLKDFYEDFFAQPCGDNEPKIIYQKTKEGFKELRQFIQEQLLEVEKYPFLSTLEPVLQTINDIYSKPYDWYLTDLSRQEDELLEIKEDVIDPIRSFMQGGQKHIYDDAQQFLESQKPNFNYIISDKLSPIITALADSQCFKGNRMQQVKGLVESVTAEISIQVKTEIEQALAEIRVLQERMSNMAEFSQLSSEQLQEILQSFEDCCDSIAQEYLIAVIRSTCQQFKTDTYAQLLSKMTNWAEENSVSENQSNEKYTVSSSSGKTSRVKESNTQYVSSQIIKVNFNKAWLADETDVEDYLVAMREALMTEIKQGKRIQI